MYSIIGNLYIFPLISLIDIVRNYRLTLMLKVIPHCDVKPSMTVQIKTMILVLDISTCIITNITARSYVLSAILLMMSTFILLLLYMYCYNRLNRNTQKSFIICLTFFVFIKIDLIALLSFCYVYIFPSLR